MHAFVHASMSSLAFQPIGTGLRAAVAVKKTLTRSTRLVLQEGEGNFVEVPKKPEGLSFDNNA